MNEFLEKFNPAVSDSTADKNAPLSGIKIAIKDNILIKGKIASGASKILENYVAPYSATVIEKILKAGGEIIGRTNMDEFAMGGSTERSAYGPTKNPHDSNRVPGGSSGGSAASVAGGTSDMALGSDTGGSIRQPASFCGVVGLKPTYGAVSRYGLMAMASSLDVIGPITKNVDDAEKLFNVIKGLDPKDSTTVDYEKNKKTTSSKKIGVPRKFLAEGVDAGVLQNFEKTLEKLAKNGYEIVDIEMPILPLSLAMYYIIMPAEVSSNMARYDGIKYGLSVEGENLKDGYFKTRGQGFGEEVKRRIILGNYVLSTGYYDAFYGSANKARKLLKEEFAKKFSGDIGGEDLCAIATPTSPTPAFKIGEKVDDPLTMYLADIFTVGANIAGIPAISVPMGNVDTDGVSLPVGIQFMAQPFGEKVLFEIGRMVESDL